LLISKQTDYHHRRSKVKPEALPSRYPKR